MSVTATPSKFQARTDARQASDLAALQATPKNHRLTQPMICCLLICDENGIGDFETDVAIALTSVRKLIEIYNRKGPHSAVVCSLKKMNPGRSAGKESSSIYAGNCSMNRKQVNAPPLSSAGARTQSSIQMARSSRFIPDPMASLNHCGCLPRPLHV